MPTRSLVALAALVLVACTQPPTAPQGSDAAILDLGAPHGRTADVQIHLPADADPAKYRLQIALPGHKWVAGDVSNYVVTLQQRTGVGPDVYTTTPLATVTVNVMADPPQSQAVFANLQQGQYYRAFVAAMGTNEDVQRPSTNLVQLNSQATADYTDFDFTTTQAAALADSAAVTVHFDGVVFNGTGTINFAAPDGLYSQPPTGPTGRATTAPGPA